MLYRIVFVFFSLIAACLIFFAVYMLDTFNNYNLNSNKENIMITLKNVHFLLAQPNNQYLIATQEITPILKELATLNKINVTLLKDNKIVASANMREIQSLEAYIELPETIDKPLIYTRSNMTNKHNLLFAATFLQVDTQMYTVLINADAEPFSNNFVHVRKILFVAILITCSLALLISIRLTKHLLSPLAEISQAAESFAEGKFEHRLYIKSNDEFAQLAHIINHLATNLAEKITETALEKQKLELILSQMDNAVILVDKPGQIHKINQPALNLFADLKYNDNINNIDLLGNAALQAAICKAFDTSESSTLDLKIKLSDAAKSFQVFISPICAVYSGKVKHVLCVFHDITALKNIFDKQVEFVANASHELRTPLTSIRGFAEAMEDDCDPQLVKKFATIIRDESLRMQRLITDLLQLAKMDSPEYQNSITITNISTDNLLESIAAEMSAQAQMKDIRINVQNNCPPQTIYSNYDWLKQALVNLAENALKYTPTGGAVSLVMDKSDTHLILQVQDSGPGMKESDLARIFERFYRIESDRSRASGGSGLGLSIVKFIIKILGADIKVSSQIGIGSTFTIKIPLKQPL